MHPAHRHSLFVKSASLLAIAALGFAAAPSAHAQTTLVDTNTLNGTFFHDSAENIVSLAQAKSYVGSSTPTGIFTATQSALVSGQYKGGDTSTPQQFLGSDGASYVSQTTLQATNLEDGIFDFKGYLDVSAANTYNFGTLSDDGSALFIDGTMIVNNDGVSSAHYAQGNDTLSAGLHPIELLYYNHVFGGGIGGANFAAGFSGLNVTNSNLPASAAPEPSAIAIWAFVGLGAAGLALKARRRKAVAA